MACYCERCECLFDVSEGVEDENGTLWCSEDCAYDYGGDWDDDFFTDIGFADPGGMSALRAETPDNPRNLPCPTCKRPDMLTPADRARGYQCDLCADVAEGRGGYMDCY